MQSIAVKVDIYGTVRDLVKETRMEVLLPEHDRATFRDVLEKVAERFGPEFRERLYAGPGQLRSARVYLRGRLVDNLDEPLPKEDAQPEVRLIFLHFVGGG
jgi:molybdopterin converting factor small subunit